MTLLSQQLRDEVAAYEGADEETAIAAADEIDRLNVEVTALRADAARYQWLRSRDLDAISQGGVFAGMTPANVVLNQEDLDAAVDAAMTASAKPTAEGDANAKR